MKVVIDDYEFPSLAPEYDAFKDVEGVEIVDMMGKCEDTAESLGAALKDADGVLNQWKHLTADVINQMENCKAIATYGIGVDKIDVEAATAKGIYVCNSPVYNKVEVSNHVVMMILALNRQLIDSDRKMRQGKYGWMHLAQELHRPEVQTVGFLGCGRIGKQAVEKLKPFEFNIIAYDPFQSAEQLAAAGVKKVDTIEELLQNADYLTINVSLTKDTFKMIGKKELAMMKKTAYVINCARGAIIDQDALAEACANGTIAGAALDVFEPEPLPLNHPLMQLDNVILTPHSAWHTRESMYDIQWYAARQVALVLKGEKPDYCVNYEAVQALKK